MTCHSWVTRSSVHLSQRMKTVPPQVAWGMISNSLSNAGFISRESPCLEILHVHLFSRWGDGFSFSYPNAICAAKHEEQKVSIDVDELRTRWQQPSVMHSRGKHWDTLVLFSWLQRKGRREFAFPQAWTMCPQTCLVSSHVLCHHILTVIRSTSYFLSLVPVWSEHRWCCMNCSGVSDFLEAKKTSPSHALFLLI